MLVPERRLGLNKRKVATADTTVRFSVFEEST